MPNALCDVAAYLCFFIFFDSVNSACTDLGCHSLYPRVADLWTTLVHELISSPIFLPVA